MSTLSASADVKSTTVPSSSVPSSDGAPLSVTKSRSIAQKVLSREQGEGHGARVRRSIGGPELRNFDPFLMLDEFKVGAPAGFPDHPHRGFETVTYMLPTTKGAFEHEDFVGHKGRIEAGDLQWMTAGRGIVHSEMPATGNTEYSHGLQLWVNLASKFKMVEPAYQELKAADIPHVTKDGVTAIVIAGSALGVTSRVYTRTPTSYLHFMMQPHSTLRQPIDSGWNAFIYVLEGEARLGGDDEKLTVGPHHTVTLTADGDGIVVITKGSACNFVVIAGKPIGEPVVQHGPFVMNSATEIRQAMVDYQSGKNGFERAPGWRSEIGKRLTQPIHDDDDDF